MRDSIAAIRRDLNPLHLDLGALSAHLDDDPEAFAGYVTEEVVFAPYEGGLQGAEGTMAAKTGNALDQALLLATLNANAGYDVRIAEGELSDADSDRLIAAWRDGALPAFDVFTPGSPTAERVGAALTALGAERDGSLAPGQTERERAGEPVLMAAEAAGIDLSPVPDAAAMRERVKRYFWVQYRESPFAEWRDVHPAFGGGAAPDVTPTGYMSGSIDQDLLHRLTISAFIERQVGEKIERERIMDDWTRPVANLESSIRSLAILPLDPPDGIDFEGADVFIPYLDGLKAPGAKMFDMNGVVLDSDLLDLGAPGAMLELFRTMGQRGGEASAAIGALDFGAPAAEDPSAESVGSELARVVLVLETDGPGGKARHERALFDRTEPDGSGGLRPREEISKTAELYRHYAFIAGSGYPAPTRTLARMLEDTERRMALFQAQLDLGEGAPNPREVAEIAEIAGDDPAKPGLLNRLAPALLTPLGADEALAYAPLRASILGLSGSPFPPRPGAPVKTVIDIVDIGWAAWRADQEGGGLLRDREAMAAFGGRATWAEAEMAEGLAESLGAAAAGDTAWSLLQGRAGAFARPESDDLSAAVEADIAAGRQAALASAESGEPVWWSFDPQTGAAIGRTTEGGSGPLVEYVVGLVSVSMSVLFAYVGVQGCAGHSSPNCCVGAALGIGLLAGGLFGFAIAELTVSVAAAGTAAAVAAQGGAVLTFELVVNAVMMLLPGDLGLCSLVE